MVLKGWTGSENYVRPKKIENVSKKQRISWENSNIG